MEELKRDLPDGSELIWCTVSSKIYRWNPSSAIFLDSWIEESHHERIQDTHIEAFVAENGSVVLKRTGGVFERVEYWVEAPGSIGALRNLLQREDAGTLNEAGRTLLEEYALGLPLA